MDQIVNDNLEISEYVEVSYNLTNIDLENIYVVIEDSCMYITDYNNFNIVFEKFEDACIKTDFGYDLYDSETNYLLSITDDQFEIIKELKME